MLDPVRQQLRRILHRQLSFETVAGLVEVLPNLFGGCPVERPVFALACSGVDVRQSRLPSPVGSPPDAAPTLAAPGHALFFPWVVGGKRPACRARSTY